MSKSEDISVRFSDTVVISNITGAHELMLSALSCDASVIVDVSDVTDVDLTFVQLLESARRSASEAGRSIQLRHPADGALLQVLQRGGFLDPAEPDRTAFWLQGASEQ